MHWYCISNAYSSHQLNGSTDLQNDSNLTNIRMKCLGITIPTNIMYYVSKKRPSGMSCRR